MCTWIRPPRAGRTTRLWLNLTTSEPPRQATRKVPRRAEHILGETAASLAHRYALSMPGVDAVVLGVKNRPELRECLAAESRGPLPAETMERIDNDISGAISLTTLVTVVALDPAARGATAAQLLSARIDGDTSSPREAVLLTRLVVRGSGELAAADSPKQAG